MSAFNTFFKGTLPLTALYFVIHTAKNLLGKKTFRSTIRGEIRKIISGSRDKPDKYDSIPEVEQGADRIMDLLHRKGIFPDSVCIDGPPGSGKSSLGRALSERYGLEWRTIYWQELKGEFYFKAGRIYENIRLIRTQAMDHFDVIIYLDCAMDEAKNRVVERDRSGALADVFDFSTFKIVGDTAFEMLAGDEMRIEKSAVRIKIRPPGGYRDLETLKARLKEKGIGVTGYSKEELLFIYCFGKPDGGLMPYAKLGAYNPQILSGVFGALAKSVTRKFRT